MHLKLGKAGKENIHLGVFSRLGRERRFEWSEGDIGVHAAIMHNSAIKEPRPSQ